MWVEGHQPVKLVKPSGADRRSQEAIRRVSDEDCEPKHEVLQLESPVNMQFEDLRTCLKNPFMILYSLQQSEEQEEPDFLLCVPEMREFSPKTEGRTSVGTEQKLYQTFLMPLMLPLCSKGILKEAFASESAEFSSPVGPFIHLNY